MASIAVVIPVRNRAAALARAVASVRRQTRPPDELIVVDDASIPPAAAALRAAPDLRVIVNSTRRGAARSRNCGAAAATSALIAFLDSDDYWAPDKLERQHALLATRPEIDLVYCDQHVVDQGGRQHPSGKTLVTEDLLRHLLDFWTAPNTSTLMFRRDRFLALGGFDENLASCQDHDLWMRIATHGLTVACVPERLSYFCFDQRDRVSIDPGARMAGVEAFLAKWRATIIEQAGARAFQRFQNRYYVAAAVPLAHTALKAGRPAALPLLARYLAANPELYRKAYARLISPRGRPPAATG